jgi:class 3 adenylate cyclase
MKELKKGLYDLIVRSLNSDQVNHLAQYIDAKFDVYKISGFGRKLSVPRQVAADSLLRYFTEEEQLVEFFEHVLQNENILLYSSRIHIRGKESLINLLNRKNWAYDERSCRFTKDQSVTFTSDWGFMRDGEEYNLSFASIDIVANSEIVRQNVRVDVDNTYSCLRSFIQKQVVSRNGRIWFWHGDGGVAAFYDHKGIMQSIVSTIAILSYLPVFNVFENELHSDNDIKLRIGIHYGSAIYKKDISKIISKDLTIAENLEKNYATPNTIVISEIVFKTLDYRLRNSFVTAGELEHGKIYKYQIPELII